MIRKMNKCVSLIKGVYHGVQRVYRRITLEYTPSSMLCRMKYREALQSLKNIHAGKRCFIIGNGPSLTPGDLDLIKNEYSFAANRIFYMFDKTTWRPTFFCAQDKDVIMDSAKNFDVFLDACENLFIINDSKRFIPKIIRDNIKTIFFCAKYVSAHKERLFSNDISNYISGGGTVTYASIQIAAFMGFKEIYLIGVDHNYASDSFNNGTISMDDIRKSYFEGMPEGIKLTKPNPDNATISYLRAKEYCQENSIKIMNATRGGKLEVFPRIQLEELF